MTERSLSTAGPEVNRKANADAAAASSSPIQVDSLNLERNLGNRGTSQLQTQLQVSQAGDADEREADSIAKQVLAMQFDAGSVSRQQEKIQRKENVSTDGSVASNVSNGESINTNAGSPLDKPTKNFFESRFGQKLEKVRVHNDSAADQSARSLNARAYTVGQHITFAGGEYQPNTYSGKELLAHELAHTVQQRKGKQRIQRQESPNNAQPQEQQPTGVVFWYSVQVDRTMNSGELLVEFVHQYRGVDVSAAQQQIAEGRWRWTGTAPNVSADDVLNGYKLIRVRDRSIRAGTSSERRSGRRYFRGLRRRDRDSINSETDQRFWDRTQYRPGELLGDSADDQRMAQYWMQVRDELIRQRRDISELPTEIRDFIFSETGRAIQPSDYEKILRIARKLMEMSDEERQSYLQRTNARTSDLTVFESSLDRYMAELRQRQAAALERERTKGNLLGLDAVYREYRAYMSMLSNSVNLSGIGIAVPGSGAVGTSIGMQPTLNRMRTDLTTHLQDHGYNSISDFEAAIHSFENAFRDEAVLIAMEMLDRYDHLLWTQQERYQDTAVTQNLHTQLAPARQKFEEAHQIRRDHASMVVMTPGEMEDQAYWSGQFRQRRAEGESAVSGLSGDHPLLGNSDIPAEDLALASQGNVAGVVQGYITARRNDVNETRQNIRDNPNLIWELDYLIQQAMVEQEIRPNSIYQLIIQDYQHDRAIERAMINLAIAVFAIAAGLVSGGGGTVAVLGATAAFGAGAYQALEEFRRYETLSAAHGAQLSSDDPSIGWVILAVVGMGIDMAGVAIAIRAMRPAVQVFNQSAGGLADLERLEASLRQLNEVNDAMRTNVLRAARGEIQTREAWKVARSRYFGSALAVMDPLVTPLIHLAVNFTYPVFLSLRQGVISMERFLLTRRAVSLVGDFRQMSPQQLARVRLAYQAAFTNAQTVATHGRGLGMLDSEIEQFLLMWNRRPNMTSQQMMAQMDQWAAPLQARAGARTRIAPEMILDDASRARLADFDQQIAGTGGIDRILVRDAPNEGRMAVTIEGDILPGRLTRRPANVTPTTRRAPDFNTSGSLHSVAEAGLNANWQRLHLWGPGFGDEAAAGMMWGPRNVNLVWQNDSIENYIRQLAELSQRNGGRTRVRATAISWENPTPRGWSAPQGDHFLKMVEYEVTLIRPGQPNQTIRVTLEVAEPPATGIRSFSIDPPNAINPASLF